MNLSVTDKKTLQSMKDFDMCNNIKENGKWNPTNDLKKRKNAFRAISII